MDFAVPFLAGLVAIAGMFGLFLIAIHAPDIASFGDADEPAGDWPASLQGDLPTVPGGFHQRVDNETGAQHHGS
jgi:hypothetical protein